MDLQVLYCIALAVISFFCLFVYQAYYLNGGSCLREALLPAFNMNIKKLAGVIFYIILAVSFYIYMDTNGSAIAKTLKYLTMLCVLATIAWIDYKASKIPNTLLIVLIAARLIFFIYESIKEPDYIKFNIIQMTFGAFLCLALLLLCRIIIRNSIGMGDIKLFAVLGLYFGYDIINLMFFSFLCTAIYSIYLLLFKKKKKKDSVPMGPFIFLGTILSFILIF